MALIARVDYHKWVPLAIPAYVTSIILSVAVIFFGDEYNGSKRWLSLGPISFQPSEFAKVAVIFSCMPCEQKCTADETFSHNDTYDDSGFADRRSGRSK